MSQHKARRLRFMHTSNCNYTITPSRKKPRGLVPVPFRRRMLANMDLNTHVFIVGGAHAFKTNPIAVAGKLIAFHWPGAQSLRRAETMHPTSARAIAVAGRLVALHWLGSQSLRSAKYVAPLIPQRVLTDDVWLPAVAPNYLRVLI